MSFLRVRTQRSFIVGLLNLVRAIGMQTSLASHVCSSAYFASFMASFNLGPAFLIETSALLFLIAAWLRNTCGSSAKE